MPTNLTPSGWTVPAQSDPPNVPSFMTELATDIWESVKTLLVPATSTQVSWATGFAQGDAAPLLYKIGRLVVVQLRVKRTGATIIGSSTDGNISNTLMGTITNAAFRPLAGTEGSLATGGGAPLGNGGITSPGNLYALSLTPGGKWPQNSIWTWRGSLVSAT